MIVLHVIQEFTLGGLEALVLSMLKADFENSYILAIEGSSSQAFQEFPMLAEVQSKLFFANKPKGFHIKTCTYIKQTCIRLSVSILHTHHIGPLIYAGLAVLTLKNMAHIHTEHDVWHLQKYRDLYFQKFLLKLNKNIHLVAVSQSVFEKLKFYFPQMDISLIHNAVDTNKFKPGNRLVARAFFDLPSDAIIIGSAGRLEEIKGHRYLIQALQKLPQKYYLVIAGSGPLYQTLISQVQVLGLAERVTLTGYVEAMNVFYQACDIFCLPSLDEGLPLALLEAQATNVKVVSTNAGGCPEAVDPASGLQVPVANVEEIARACLDVLKTNGEPRQFIIQNFSIDVLISRYRELYLRALQ